MLQVSGASALKRRAPQQLTLQQAGLAHAKRRRSALASAPLPMREEQLCSVQQVSNRDILQRANQRRDLLGAAHGNTTLQTRKGECSLQAVWSSDLDDIQVADMVETVQTNLKHMYSEVWGWSSKQKRLEITHPDTRVLLVRHNGADAAFASFRFVEEHDVCTLYLYEIHVRETLRGSGLGKALMQTLESIARRVSCERLALTVFAKNEEALAFYRRLGYIPDMQQSYVDIEAFAKRRSLHRAADGALVLEKTLGRATRASVRVRSRRKGLPIATYPSSGRAGGS